MENPPGPPPDPSFPEGPLRIFARPWFWAIALVVFWTVPLYKSLAAEYPPPLPGYDREPYELELHEDTGRQVAFSDLAGNLIVAQPLDMGSPQTAERDFAAFRKRKNRLRGLGSLVVQALLVQHGEPGQVSSFVESKTARRPTSLFLMDGDGAAFDGLRRAADAPAASLFLLDRHARLRGAYGLSPAELDRFAQDLAVLANWIGSDPEPGMPVHH